MYSAEVRKMRESTFAKLCALGVSEDDVSLLLRHAHTINRINEIDCSEDLSDRPRYERTIRRQEETATRRIKEICAKYPNAIKSVQIDGDPRGYPVKVQLVSGQFNTWGGAESGFGFGG